MKVFPLTTAKRGSESLVYGCVAQLVAQLTLNQLVVGSSPTTPRIKEAHVSEPLLFVEGTRTPMRSIQRVRATCEQSIV